MNRTLAGRPPATLVMLCACLAWVFVIPPTAHALDPDKRLTQYLHRSFRIADGSAPESMFTITQTTDGFLWFALTLQARVGERTRIARELHDTLLQSFHGLLLRFQTASYLLPQRPTQAKEKLDDAIEHAARAITDGRDAVQGLRASTVERNDLAKAIKKLGDELTNNANDHRARGFDVVVEGEPRDVHPIVRDEIDKIAAEALRNAFRHADPTRIEVEIHYDDQQFRLRVRDDGKGIDPAVLASEGVEGHYGLRGMPERGL